MAKKIFAVLIALSMTLLLCSCRSAYDIGREMASGVFDEFSDAASDITKELQELEDRASKLESDLEEQLKEVPGAIPDSETTPDETSKTKKLAKSILTEGYTLSADVLDYDQSKIGGIEAVVGTDSLLINLLEQDGTSSTLLLNGHKVYQLYEQDKKYTNEFYNEINKELFDFYFELFEDSLDEPMLDSGKMSYNGRELYYEQFDDTRYCYDEAGELAAVIADCGTLDELGQSIIAFSVGVDQTKLQLPDDYTEWL